VAIVGRAGDETLQHFFGRAATGISAASPRAEQEEFDAEQQGEPRSAPLRLPIRNI
jgi:hypothetical protein